MKYELIKNRIEDLREVERPPGIKSVEIKFALNTLQGFGPQEAFRLAWGNHLKEKTPAQLSKAANKMKNKPVVQRYMKALIRELERVAVANALDLQMFLSAAIFTPIGQIDENHPLCQKKTESIITQKDGTTIERTTLEMVPKLEAARTLIRMKGLDAPIRVDHTHRVGVMIVPMAASVEDWEKMAVTSQQTLMEDAINID